MKLITLVFFTSIFQTFYISNSAAQWSPAGLLLDVPLRNDCSMTNGQVAAAKTDGMFYCPARASEINSEVPDASHFDVVHAYGLLAIHTTSKKLADCWAARKIAASTNGAHYIKQWIKYWQIHGRVDPNYGTPDERISNVRSCCACGV